MEDRLLHLTNESWRRGCCPYQWRSAIIVPIRKKGKPASQPSSYRPVALTSVIAKTVERMVHSRLTHILESGNMLSACQAGFRRGHSTEEQLARVTQDIFDGFEERPHKRSVMALLDFNRAYDKV